MWATLRQWCERVNPGVSDDLHTGRVSESVLRLEGTSATATLDLHAQTLTFEHHGSVSTERQKALSPLIVPLGAIVSVECRRGRSTNWFQVVRRGEKPWRDGAWSDPCGIVSVEDPQRFAEHVRSGVAAATPVVADVAGSPGQGPRSGRWAAKFARALVDGFFSSR